MKTIKITIELPESLMDNVRQRTENEHSNLDNAIAELLERGMNVPDISNSIRLPKVAKVHNCGPLTTEEIEAAINWGR